MSLEYDAFISSGKKWFCHVDDDNYLNTGSLLKLLSQYSHTQDVYIGRPSLERPIEATERPGTDEMQVRFWFATGGAGFCLSRGLSLKMKPWASDGTFMTTAEHIRLPDDCTVGYIVEALLGVSLIRSGLFHSHLENLGLVSDIHNQVTLSYGTVDNSRNTVNVKGLFTIEEDPTRFRSVHCLLDKRGRKGWTDGGENVNICRVPPLPTPENVSRQLGDLCLPLYNSTRRQAF
uniref:Beta-1,3-N-acetylglucosaminyltransferase lunatic fringe-like n=1 Tax=Pundamilia nyererei TaxID=303518 RepID=A0A3B4FE44_9CICH